MLDQRQYARGSGASVGWMREQDIVPAEEANE